MCVHVRAGFWSFFFFFFLVQGWVCIAAERELVGVSSGRRFVCVHVWGVGVEDSNNKLILIIILPFLLQAVGDNGAAGRGITWEKGL